MAQLTLVAAGLGGAMLPRPARPVLPAGVCVVPVVRPVPTRRVVVAWREASGPRPAVRAAVAALRSAWDQAERSAARASATVNAPA
ncbi:hypothetical protein Sya03_27050 [Spirilliplanes yamanashiensis]|uniref:LysR substrate-binding domain-containing protein n=2 Tax=Spirilliplanes yamanashiensis TaxID=42233 RepID=A0A8J3Y8V2_9ACTN|nr:hypothetical protein Sya03_27050 [Spirilliplanes yamanashiensis]